MSTCLVFYLTASMIILALGFLAAILIARNRRKHSWFTFSKIIIITVFFSLAFLLFPLIGADTPESEAKHFLTLLLTFYTSLQVFMVNVNFEIVNRGLEGYAGLTANIYSIYAAILYVTAPVLFANLLVSFFHNISSYKQYIFKFHKDIYIFSKLNSRSLALAESELRFNKNAVAVFTDVYLSGEEHSFELIQSAKSIGAILFSMDILSVKFELHKQSAKIKFFIMGNDESENLEQAVGLSNKFKDRKNTCLYVFSSTVSSELLLSGKSGNMTVRRINEIQSLIYQTLYKQGHNIYKNTCEESNKRIISVILLGLGLYGTEMLRALVWFGQMDGYQLEVEAFDSDNNAESKFAALYPELMDSDHNGVSNEGDAYYSIRIHSSTDAKSRDFTDYIAGMRQITYCFVSLGNDDINIDTAVYLRMLCKRNGKTPLIHTVTYDSKKANILKDAVNFKGEAYEIECIGDLKSQYSHEVVTNSELEEKALDRHLYYSGVPQTPKTTTEKENYDTACKQFYMYEYFYRSSVAGVIHKAAKLYCGIPGEDKSVDERTDEEKMICRLLEKRRWNAYMRSEGFVYGGSLDRTKGRSDIAKQHNLLVPWDQLPDDEKCKDDV